MPPPWNHFLLCATHWTIYQLSFTYRVTCRVTYCKDVLQTQEAACKENAPTALFVFDRRWNRTSNLFSISRTLPGAWISVLQTKRGCKLTFSRYSKPSKGFYLNTFFVPNHFLPAWSHVSFISITLPNIFLNCRQRSKTSLIFTSILQMIRLLLGVCECFMASIKGYGKHIRRYHKWAHRRSICQFNIAALVDALVQVISYRARVSPDLSSPVDSACPRRPRWRWPVGAGEEG